jgi:large subunit ribosomal protein L13
MRTVSTTPAQAQEARAWWVVDATGVPVGRLASKVAMVLRGKHKTSFTPHVDTGDFVVVINAEKVRMTGNKPEQQLYHTHAGRPGHLKSISFENAIESKPELPIRHAVKGMLPKNVLGRQLIKKLKIYAGDNHPHAAQQPKLLSV